jgi:aminomethyltransferase
MVDFAGYAMPLRYTSIRDEHVAVRTRAGLFDLCHMGEVRLWGESAEATVQRLVANDVSSLTPGRAVYAVVCNDDAGIVDDVLVYRVEDGFLVVVNAARRHTDLEWMRSHLLPGTELHDESDETALLAVQGPEAVAIVQTLTGSDLSALRSFSSVAGTVAEVPCRLSRTGYTGEDGLELYCEAAAAPRLWEALLETGAGHGLLPVGLGARDTLRLEAGLRLYGQDMDESVDPFSCGLGWTVKLGKGEFIGASRLRQLDPDNPPRRFIGLALGPRHIPRHGMTVRAGDEPVGEVTSGGFSFSLGHGIATAYVVPQLADAPLSIDIRGEVVPALRVPLPFYHRGRSAGREPQAIAPSGDPVVPSSEYHRPA